MTVQAKPTKKICVKRPRSENDLNHLSNTPIESLFMFYRAPNFSQSCAHTFQSHATANRAWFLVPSQTSQLRRNMSCSPPPALQRPKWRDTFRDVACTIPASGKKICSCTVRNVPRVEAWRGTTVRRAALPGALCSCSKVSRKGHPTSNCGRPNRPGISA